MVVQDTGIVGVVTTAIPVHKLEVLGDIDMETYRVQRPSRPARVTRSE